MDTPTFEATLQRHRAHELAEPAQAHLRAGQLVYRYLDTGECVSVPNVWYNQPPELRAESYEVQAVVLEQLAASMSKRPSNLMLPLEMQRLGEHYRQQALAFRAQAARFRGESLRQIVDQQPVRQSRSKADNPAASLVARR
ncbi:hypothetical protein [Chitinimonas sp. BJYL2]|uniref:hypothetical protein n=1 Tax=Chitinimonas sp. BJYL2 TaxID=2976696 RepID=UPI0022B4B929|nr:hypothetical protein [Chitinimonas sp. BJYL2]